MTTTTAIIFNLASVSTAAAVMLALILAVAVLNGVSDD